MGRLKEGRKASRPKNAGDRGATGGEMKTKRVKIGIEIRVDRKRAREAEELGLRGEIDQIHIKSILLF